MFGAAGVVFVCDVAEGHDPPVRAVMLQLRSAFSHEGGTWSCAGGALDEGETPLEGALREASEEIGPIPVTHRVLGSYEFHPADDWTYTTSVVEVDEPFGRSMNFETDAVAWVPVADVEELPLHSGFAAAWPHLRAIVDGPVVGVDGQA
jgi:8-oxo-dGTP pyrophosphatase MutT (NUDIX family)